MSYNKNESKYIPETLEETWILQDNQQRLPDEIYLDPEYQFQHYKMCNLILNFSDFNRYKKENGVLFKRIKHLNDIQDMYQTEDKRYLDCIFAPLYTNRVPEGKTFADYETEEIKALNKKYFKKLL